MKTSFELADLPRYTPPPAYQSPRYEKFENNLKNEFDLRTSDKLSFLPPRRRTLSEWLKTTLYTQKKSIVNFIYVLSA